MQEIIDGFRDELGPYLPRLIGALAILIVGWIVATVASSAARRVLHRTDIDNRLASWLGSDDGGDGSERAIGSIVFWVVMLLVIVAALESLALTTVTEPLNQALDQIFGFAPRLIGAAIILVVAWVIARVVKTVLVRVLTNARIDERLGVGDDGGVAGQAALSQSLGEAGYWLVFLLFLPALLGALAVEGLLRPVQNLVDTVLVFIPNVVAAALILAVGWFVATLVRRIVSNLTAALGVNALGERVGLDSAQAGQRPSDILGLIVYAFILIPTLIAGLNALQLQAVAQPTSNMLGTILSAVPNIFAAGLVLVIAYVVGRIVAELVTGVLAGIGFNGLPARLGLAGQATVADRTPSQLAGGLLLGAIMFFAAMEAVNLLGFLLLAELVSEFVTFGGGVLLGLVIIGIGLFFANLAATAVRATGVAQVGLLSVIARVAIIVFALAVGLREMGIANEIIILAFGLPLGALAIATAIALGVSLGVGGREVAARELESLRQSIRSE